MNRSYFICLFSLLFINSTTVLSQEDLKNVERLKVFIDCRNTRCDLTFIKTEITIVDFLLDHLSADVHILINSHSTGGGGRRYEMLFFGQNRLQQLTDTIAYYEKANTTITESRELLLQYLKLGLVTFIVHTNSAQQLYINMKPDSIAMKPFLANKTNKDPWNYWVMTLSADGNVNGEQLLKSYGYNGNISSSRITEELKLGFSLWGSKSKATYTFETDTSSEKYIAKTSYYGLQHSLVKSINNHWSAGYEMIFNNSTYSNYKSQLYIRTAIEYNIFPYREINDRYFSLSYSFITRFNNYYDTTVYDKLKETLFAHSFRLYLALNKKWGAINAGVSYHNFFHEWRLNSLSVNFNVSVRVTGGLSFYISSNGGLVHDQVYLAKAGASEKEILTRLRQLKSSYYFNNRFGISYRFGSKLNNFVNPRFEGG